LSQLLGGAEGKPMQVELSTVRVLFELFGFLLNASVWAGDLKGLNTEGTERYRIGIAYT
jgi:hypothetical protein